MPSIHAALSPTTRYRYGERTTTAREAHADQAADHRQAAAEQALPAGDRQAILRAIRSGASVRDAAQQFGTTYQRVYGYALRDDDFRRQLDEATESTCICEGTGWLRERRGGRRCDCPTARAYRAQEERRHRAAGGEPSRA